MNGCKQPTRSLVSRQVQRRRILKRRLGLSSDQLADFLADTLRRAVEVGHLRPPLLLIALGANLQLMAVRYDQIGTDSGGAVLYERMDQDLFTFPVQVFITDALDQTVHATRATLHSPTSFQTTLALHFGVRHAY